MDDFFDWLEHGMQKGWISQSVCVTHEGLPMRDWEEFQTYEQGEDTCLFAVRVWEDGYEGLTLEDFK